jgi:hypothetical protein
MWASVKYSIDYFVRISMYATNVYRHTLLLIQSQQNEHRQQVTDELQQVCNVTSTTPATLWPLGSMRQRWVSIGLHHKLYIYTMPRDDRHQYSMSGSSWNGTTSHWTEKPAAMGTHMTRHPRRQLAMKPSTAHAPCIYYPYTCRNGGRDVAAYRYQVPYTRIDA